MKKSDWMEGLLWAEEYLKNNSTGDLRQYLIRYLNHWENNLQWSQGAIAYLDYYESVLEDISTQ